MAAALYSDYPPELTGEQHEHLLSVVKNWSIQHGLTVKPQPSFVPKDVDPHAVLATNAPITLFPTPFPKPCFDGVVAIQSAYNELYAAISGHEEWLGKIMEE